MKKETIEFALRTTWQQITNMYNEKALKYGGTMTMAFTLLSIDADGTPSTTLGPKMGMESTSLSRLLNTMEERELISRKQILRMVEVYSFFDQKGKQKRDLSKKIVLEFNNGLEKNR